MEDLDFAGGAIDQLRETPVRLTCQLRFALFMQGGAAISLRCGKETHSDGPSLKSG
jgi:hypothetical protein